MLRCYFAHNKYVTYNNERKQSYITIIANLQVPSLRNCWNMENLIVD